MATPRPFNAKALDQSVFRMDSDLGVPDHCRYARNGISPMALLPDDTTIPPARLYVSRVLGKSVLDAQGAKIARVKDFIVRFGTTAHPPVTGLVARHDRRDFYLSWDLIASHSAAGFQMSSFTVDLRPFERRTGEMLLRRDILDKQLIDVRWPPRGARERP